MLMPILGLSSSDVPSEQSSCQTAVRCKMATSKVALRMIVKERHGVRVARSETVFNSHFPLEQPCATRDWPTNL